MERVAERRKQANLRRFNRLNHFMRKVQDLEAGS